MLGSLLYSDTVRITQCQFVNHPYICWGGVSEQSHFPNRQRHCLRGFKMSLCIIASWFWHLRRFLTFVCIDIFALSWRLLYARTSFSRQLPSTVTWWNNIIDNYISQGRERGRYWSSSTATSNLYYGSRNTVTFW